jgi:hypothetical protein
MGQPMETLLELSKHIGDTRARVSLTVAAIATATASGSGSAAARAEATGGLRVNTALQDAAEKLGHISAAREAVARLGQLATAAAMDESELPALRAARRATQ